MNNRFMKYLVDVNSLISAGIDWSKLILNMIETLDECEDTRDMYNITLFVHMDGLALTIPTKILQLIQRGIVHIETVDKITVDIPCDMGVAIPSVLTSIENPGGVTLTIISKSAIVYFACLHAVQFLVSSSKLKYNCDQIYHDVNVVVPIMKEQGTSAERMIMQRIKLTDVESNMSPAVQPDADQLKIWFSEQ